METSCLTHAKTHSRARQARAPWTCNCDSSASVPIVSELHMYLCREKGLCIQSMRCLNFSLYTRPQRPSGFRTGVDTLDAGSQNASHFARVFPKLEGTPPLPGSERIMCRRQSSGRLVHSEVVSIMGVRLAFDCRQHGSKFLLLILAKAHQVGYSPCLTSCFNQLSECQLVGCALIEFLLEKIHARRDTNTARTYAASSKPFWHRECIYPES